MIFMTFMKRSFHTLSRRFLGFNDACVFCLTIIRSSMHSSRLVLQSIAAGIGTSNFLRTFFMVSLNSSSAGSMKQLPRNLLALSSFGFFDSPLLLRFASLCFLLHQTCASTFLATKGRRLLSCQSRADHVFPPGGFRSDIVSET